MSSVTMTEKAADAIREIAKANGKELAAAVYDEGKLYVRFSVQGGGCAGFKYLFGLAETYAEGEELESFDNHGVLVVVPKKAIPLLDGTVIDYDSMTLPPKFVFENPNVVSSCGCSNSFSTSKGGCQ